MAVVEHFFEAFNASTDITITFTNMPGSIYIYTEDDNLLVGFEEATGTSSTRVKRGVPTEFSIPSSYITIKGITGTGNVQVTSVPLYTGPKDSAIRAQMYVRS